MNLDVHCICNIFCHQWQPIFLGHWSICCICRKQNKGKKHQNYMLIIYWFNFSMKKNIWQIFLIQAVIIQQQMMNKESIKLTALSLKTYTTFCIIIQLNATKLQLVKLSTVYCIVLLSFFPLAIVLSVLFDLRFLITPVHVLLFKGKKWQLFLYHNLKYLIVKIVPFCPLFF